MRRLKFPLLPMHAWDEVKRSISIQTDPLVNLSKNRKQLKRNWLPIVIEKNDSKHTNNNRGLSRIWSGRWRKQRIERRWQPNLLFWQPNTTKAHFPPLPQTPIKIMKCPRAKLKASTCETWMRKCIVAM